MKKILLLEEDRSLRMLLAEDLTEEGYSVVTCGDGGRILSILEWERPHLLIMESRLSEVSGLDLLQEIRAAHYDLPVIVWTSETAAKHDPRAMAADYLVIKRADDRELKRRIEQALECSAPEIRRAGRNQAGFGGARSRGLFTPHCAAV